MASLYLHYTEYSKSPTYEQSPLQELVCKLNVFTSPAKNSACRQRLPPVRIQKHSMEDRCTNIVCVGTVVCQFFVQPVQPAGLNEKEMECVYPALQDQTCEHMFASVKVRKLNFLMQGTCCTFNCSSLSFFLPLTYVLCNVRIPDQIIFLFSPFLYSSLIIFLQTSPTFSKFIYAMGGQYAQSISMCIIVKLLMQFHLELDFKC